MQIRRVLQGQVDAGCESNGVASRHAGAYLCEAWQGQVSASHLKGTWEICCAATLPGSDAHLQALIAQAHMTAGIADMSPAADTAVT